MGRRLKLNLEQIYAQADRLASRVENGSASWHDVQRFLNGLPADVRALVVDMFEIVGAPSSVPYCTGDKLPE